MVNRKRSRQKQPRGIDLQFLRELVAIDSPTGFTDAAAVFLVDAFKRLGVSPVVTNRGSVSCVRGNAPTLCIAAHFDTLGAVISEIAKDGTIRISPLASLPATSFEGEYLRIHTRAGQVYTGTLLIDNPSDHANKKVSAAERSYQCMHVRLDVEAHDEDSLAELGIGVGDFVCFYPRYEELSTGYIKSRFMDNKAGCLVVYEILRWLVENYEDIPIQVLCTSSEENGAGGASGIAPSVTDLLVIDMGVIGERVAGKETAVSICTKDSRMPYDYQVTSTLINLAKRNKIPHEIAVYPYYSSDAAPAISAGRDLRAALIGPGVSASHGVERTHIKGIEATVNLTKAFIKSWRRN